MVVGAVQGQVVNCLRCSNFGVLDELNEVPFGREVEPTKLENPGGDGGREEEILGLGGAIFADKFKNCLNVLLKALLQHFVCLI